MFPLAYYTPYAEKGTGQPIAQKGIQHEKFGIA